MKKKILGVLSILICALLGAARWLDLANFTELSTGFATVGEAWMRYAAMGAGVVLLFIFSRFMSRRPAALQKSCGAFGGLLVLTGASLVFFAAITLLEWYFGAAPVMMSGNTVAALIARYFGGAAWMDAATGFLAMLAGVWAVVRGVSAFHPLESQDPARAPLGILCALFYVWLLVCRFAVEPASTERIGMGMLVISALAALLFAASCIKVFCLPGAPIGRGLFFTGMTCFLLCTCSELLQTLCGLISGSVDLLADPWGIPLGLLGLCGLAGAWCATGEDAKSGAA